MSGSSVRSSSASWKAALRPANSGLGANQFDTGINRAGCNTNRSVDGDVARQQRMRRKVERWEQVNIPPSSATWLIQRGGVDAIGDRYK